jgi:hypothetical protein
MNTPKFFALLASSKEKSSDPRFIEKAEPIIAKDGRRAWIVQD